MLTLNFIALPVTVVVVLYQVASNFPLFPFPRLENIKRLSCFIFPFRRYKFLLVVVVVMIVLIIIMVANFPRYFFPPPYVLSFTR